MPFLVGSPTKNGIKWFSQSFGEGSRLKRGFFRPSSGEKNRKKKSPPPRFWPAPGHGAQVGGGQGGGGKRFALSY